MDKEEIEGLKESFDSLQKEVMKQIGEFAGNHSYDDVTEFVDAYNELICVRDKIIEILLNAAN